MTNKYDWLNRRTPRSVDALKLWLENPRLDPDEEFNSTNEVAEGFISTDSDRADFLSLMRAIHERGFIPADPIVVWQDAKTKAYYVAEGNRRVLALKLLRQPTLAPKAIRGTVVKLASSFDKTSVDKIPVSVAPTFDDAEWYISQRNSLSSLQKHWSAEQQRRWIAERYEKYKGNVAKVKEQTDMSESQLQDVIRLLKIKEFVKDIKGLLSEEEYIRAKSVRFPITTLERFFVSSPVREKWGITFEGYDVVIKSDRNSFLTGYAALIKRMLLPKGNISRVDSRTTSSNAQIEEILHTLPEVTFPKASENPDLEEAGLDSEEGNENPKDGDSDQESTNGTKDSPIEPPAPRIKNDPNRSRVIDNSYHISTDQMRLDGIFKEMKEMPLKYSNAIAASIRIFLDLAVLDFLNREGLVESLLKEQKRSELRDVQLKPRLEFVRKKIQKEKASQIIGKLLIPTNEFSLDVLNGYQHSADVHFLNKSFLNRFWDFMFPLFRELVDIREEND